MNQLLMHDYWDSITSLHNPPFSFSFLHFPSPFCSLSTTLPFSLCFPLCIFHLLSIFLSLSLSLSLDLSLSLSIPFILHPQLKTYFNQKPLISNLVNSFYYFFLPPSLSLSLSISLSPSLSLSLYCMHRWLKTYFSLTKRHCDFTKYLNPLIVKSSGN